MLCRAKSLCDMFAGIEVRGLRSEDRRLLTVLTDCVRVFSLCSSFMPSTAVVGAAGVVDLAGDNCDDVVEAGDDGSGVFMEESSSLDPFCAAVNPAKVSDASADVFDIELPILWEPEVSNLLVVYNKLIDSSCCAKPVGSAPEFFVLLLLKYGELQETFSPKPRDLCAISLPAR